MLHSWTLQLHVIVETLCMTDDTFMDIMLAHLLIKLNTYMLRPVSYTHLTLPTNREV